MFNSTSLFLNDKLMGIILYYTALTWNINQLLAMGFMPRVLSLAQLDRVHA